MANSVVNDVFGKEEVVFAGVVTGTLQQYKDLLNSLGDVDVRGMRQRTLLYIAVGLGKIDWVEGLLEKGANPTHRDVEGVSVLELAQELAEKNPGHEDCQSICKLVRLVMIGRDSVAQGGCNPTCQDAGMEAIGQNVISVLSRKMESICESINDVQSRMVSLREEMSTIRNLINDVKTEMATINTQAMQEMSTVRGSVEEVKTRMTDIATQLQEIGAYCNYIHYLNVRRECVEAMMRKTRILESDEGKVTKARGWYEKLYSKGDETACLIQFLKSHDDVSIEIDFDSWFINRMESSFTDHDGVEKNSIGYHYFADFEEKKIYLGGGGEDENWTIGYLAGALAQMSVCLAFNNGGRPNAKGDDVTVRQMKNALQEAEEEYRRNGDGLDWFIEAALGMETQRGKEVYLTSAVPSIIAEDGSTDGTSRLQEQVPLLLELFRDSVMPALLAKAQV